MHKDRSLIIKWRRERNQESITKLYNDNFPKIKNIILKYFFYDQFKVLIEKDDLIQILDLSFLEALKTYDLKNTKYSFLKYFFYISKYKILDTYRKYSYNSQKVLHKAFNIKLMNEYLIEKFNSYDFSQQEKEEEIEKNHKKEEQIKFLNLFYKKMSKKDVKKKILYYKLRNYSSKKISEKMNLDIRIVIYQWNNLKAKIKKDYTKWKNMQNK